MMLNYKLLSCTLTLLAAGGALWDGILNGNATEDTLPVAAAPVVEETATPVPTIPPPANPVVEIAICLDTSGSMKGLLDAARQKIWAIVNEFVFAEPMPVLRVALLTFGNDGHSQENGWVQQEVGLTEDLDMVSKLLFEQTTNGGTELVGRVVAQATGNLQWSQEPGALKLIVVAGNESADQDQVVRFADASKAAITADIMVNAIYCGPPSDNLAPGWQQVARLADGQFSAIDHNNGTLVMTTPMDAQLASLSAGLNKTYLAFGSGGDWNLGNQVAQDLNAVGLNTEAAASRAFCKANGLYNCASWDLVDAMKQEDFVLADLELSQLPTPMQIMTLEQQVAHIETMGKQRQQIQAQINEVGAKRASYIEAERKRQNLDDSNSFDKAFRKALRSQATAKGYRFKVEEAPVVEAQAVEGAAAPQSAPNSSTPNSNSNTAPVQTPAPVPPTPQTASYEAMKKNGC